jgi:hypothetical protein
VISGPEKQVGVTQDGKREILGRDRGEADAELDFASYGDQGKQSSSSPAAVSSSVVVTQITNGTKLQNVFVFVPSTSSWRAGFEEEMENIKTTHTPFVKPVNVAQASFAGTQPNQLAYFPAIPVAMYPQSQQVSVLSHSATMKQYWVPKTFGLPDDVKSKMFVGASDVNVQRTAENTDGPKPPSAFTYPTKAARKYMEDDSVSEEEEEYESRPQKKMPIKKAYAKKKYYDEEIE